MSLKNLAILSIIGGFLILGMALLVSNLQTIPANYPTPGPTHFIVITATPTP